MNKLQMLGIGIATALLVSACGGSGGGDTCPTTGTGSMAVTILGLPGGVNAAVTVTGSGAPQNLTATQTLPGLAAGNYTVTADKVAQANPLIRTAFSPTVTTSPTCVRDAQTAAVTVQYNPIPTSNKLWTNNGPGGTAPTLGFAASLLGATSAPVASIAANTFNLRYVTFDKDGNLWGIGGTTADPNVARFPASSFATSGAKTADRAINISGVSCLPGPNSLAFDAGGNLWVSIQCANKVVRLTAAQLGASATVTPAVEITGLNGPQGLAFDSAGNLWIANTGAARVVRYNASRLTASTGAAPDLTIESKTPSPSIITLDVHHLAFDSGGNLWVVAFAANVVYRLTAGDQGGTATKTITPAIQISIAASGLLEGIAFDEGGGMWIPLSAGKFGRLAPAQLSSSSSSGSPTTPERVISSPDMGFANSLAMYPAPSNLPLFHKIP